MSIISYLHEFINEEKCLFYIHNLRWKDRQLECPHCHSLNVGPWGNYHRRPGLKRYMCKDCERTFNDLTNTMLSGAKLPMRFLILVTFLLCLSCSCRRICRELGVHVRTAYRWCWWLRNAALSYEVHRQLEGTVEADEIYQTAGNKGQSKTGGSKELEHLPRRRGKKQPPGRGHYEKDSPAIIAWISRTGYTVLQVVRDFTIETVQKAANIAVKTGSVIYTDSAKSYAALVGYVHDSVNHSQREYARGEVHENRAENTFSLLRPFLAVFRGIGKANLPGYIGFFQFLRNFRNLNAFQQAEMILYVALDPNIAGTARKGEFVRQFDHFQLLHTQIN
jgi:transposase-like protein